MTTHAHTTLRHFVTYTGVSLPLRLTTPLEASDLQNRITFYRAYYNAQDQLTDVEKVVYGEIESSHHYRYHANGNLLQARIVVVADEETTLMAFADDGTLLSTETID